MIGNRLQKPGSEKSVCRRGTVAKALLKPYQQLSGTQIISLTRLAGQM